MSLELVNVRWQPGFHIIGFALFKDKTTFKLVAKYGVAYGYKEDEDVAHIRCYGTRMTFSEANAFFPGLVDEVNHISSL
jgi:hypothetical protein